MFTDWWECSTCSFATNSPKNAQTHELETGHKMEESES